MDNTFNNNLIEKGSYNAYIYKDFKYNQINIPYDINDEILKLTNEHAKELFLNSIKNHNLIVARIFDNNDIYRDKLDCIMENDKNSLIEYLTNHVNDSSNKDYKILIYRTDYIQKNTYKTKDIFGGIYFINDVQGFYNFIDSIKDCR